MTSAAAVTAAGVLAEARARGLSHVALACVDWDGRLRTKHYAVALLEAAFDSGLAMTTAIFAQGPQDLPIAFGPFEDPAGGYPDGTLDFDPRSARDAPFEAGGEGLLLIGQFVPPYADYCPRALLARELARWSARGLAVHGAFEIEFALLDETSRSLASKSAGELCLAPGFERMYSLVDQVAAGSFLHALEDLAGRMRMPLASVHHEFKGLVEAALEVAEGVAIADNAALLRGLAAIVAARDARLACFMARVAPTRQSAGAHLNLSLCRGGEPGRDWFDLDAPLRLGPTLRHFIGGLERYLPELFVLCAPNVNSYKRFAPDCVAPRANCWGIDNKTAAYRVVNTDSRHARLEVRVPGADVNPHLALTAILAAGRAGVEQALAPTPACDGDAAALAASRPFPARLSDAVQRWRASPLAQTVFGAAFVDAYARSREWQQHLFDSAVTDWELQMYARQA